MSDQRPFPICDVLTCTTGRLMGSMSGVYRVMQFICGFPVYTHQIPRLSLPVAKVILAQHPQLPTAADADARNISPENVLEVLADWSAQFGETITLKPAAKGSLVFQDPIDEAVEMIGKDNVIVVKP